jgi:hypothetical protein
MTRRREVQIIQPIPQLPVSRRGVRRWWLSAVVYLTLCVWLGPTAAFWLTVIGAWTLFWFYLCGKWPILGRLTSAFLVGFIGGLFSNRASYRPYGPRRRRPR